MGMATSHIKPDKLADSSDVRGKLEEECSKKFSAIMSALPNGNNNQASLDMLDLLDLLRIFEFTHHRKQ